MAREQSEDFTLLKVLKIYGRFLCGLIRERAMTKERIIFGLIALVVNICFGLLVIGVLGFFNIKLNQLVIGLGALATFFAFDWLVHKCLDKQGISKFIQKI